MQSTHQVGHAVHSNQRRQELPQSVRWWNVPFLLKVYGKKWTRKNARSLHVSCSSFFSKLTLTNLELFFSRSAFVICWLNFKCLNYGR